MRNLAANEKVKSNQDSDSWSQLFSNAIGWFNPFPLTTSNRIRVVLVLAILQSLMTKAAASYCFESAEGHDNTLDCINGQEDGLITLLQNSCGIYNDGQNDCANFFTESQDFGQGYFGGSICTLIYHCCPDPCIVDVLSKNVKDGYGTTQDILATMGIALGGLLTLTGISTCAYRLFSSRNRHQINEHSPLMNLNEDHSFGTKFDEMSERLSALNDIQDESLEKLKRDFAQFKDDYTCPLTLSIMSDPATLPCSHSFELADIMKISEEGKPCPCCRAPFRSEQIQANQVKQAEITITLIDLFQRLEDVEKQNGQALELVVN